MTARTAVVVFNPTKVDDAPRLRARVDRVFTGAGWDRPRWVETSREDPGRGAAEQAVRDGAALVVACGGDGTVTACAEGLAESGVPLAMLPVGTGNLLARNLDVPVDLDGALRVAVQGVDRPIDLGVVDERRFAVMAGMGFDAAVMADAPEPLKRRVGWLAYVVSAARHLRGPHMAVTLRFDGGDPQRRRARTVLVGNVGALQGGVPLMPDAEPDDGLLDVVVVGGVLRNRRLERHRARSVEVRCDREQQRQVDGDPLPPGDTLTVSIDPGALLVRVPPRERAGTG